MSRAIQEEWRSKVKKDDTIYLLGDISLNPNRIKDIIPTLPGYKVLIPGNHDQCFKWHDSVKYQNKMKKYYDMGFNEIHQTLKLSLKDGREVLMSHLPYASEDGAKFDSRYMEYRPKDEGMILAHGHTHCRYIKMGRMIDVGFDGNLKFYDEDEIIALIKDPREVIDSRITEFYKTRTEQNEWRKQNET